VIVASPNNTHHDITMAAIERDLAVLCEKPVALTAAEAEAMAEAAAARGLVTMVPFTYRWMPTHQWIKELIDDGYVGRPYHLTLRYFAGFARDPAYSWRFDVEHSGGGLLRRPGSHCRTRPAGGWARCRPSALSTTFVDRRPRPTAPVRQGTMRRRSRCASTRRGRHPQVSAMCWGTPFARPDVEIHGSDGTLSRSTTGTRCRRCAVRAGELGLRVLPVPEHLWQGARRSPVPDTYRDIFRRSDSMARTWVDAVVDGRPCQPDLAEGARVQRLLETAAESARSDSRVLPVVP
jgi:predicted dehydrogenase